MRFHLQRGVGAWNEVLINGGGTKKVSLKQQLICQVLNITEDLVFLKFWYPTT